MNTTNMIQHPTIAAVFHNLTDVERAMAELKRLGFRDDEVSLISKKTIAGTLMGLGIPEHEAKYYESELQAGHYLVIVAAGQRYNEVWSIFERMGAYNHLSASPCCSSSSARGTQQPQQEPPHHSHA